MSGAPPANGAAPASMPRRRSLGGRAVEDSLLSAGFDLARKSTALVETARPTLRPFRFVLAQNAWNLLPSREFRRLLQPYPWSMKFRARLRRFVARLNLRRAATVVCLTEYMRGLCLEAGIRHAVMVPVTVPYGMVLDVTRAGNESRIALVPGTVTWYKRTIESLELVSALKPVLGQLEVILAGPDDGSGCLEAALARAVELGMACRHVVVPHDEMAAMYRSAEVVVVNSELESLGLPIAEALVCGARVLASRVPAHQELAARAGVTPTWTDDPDPWLSLTSIEREVRATSSALWDDEWVSLGRALELTER